MKLQKLILLLSMGILNLSCYSDKTKFYGSVDNSAMRLNIHSLLSKDKITKIMMPNFYSKDCYKFLKGINLFHLRIHHLKFFVPSKKNVSHDVAFLYEKRIYLSMKIDISSN